MARLVAVPVKQGQSTTGRSTSHLSESLTRLASGRMSDRPICGEGKLSWNNAISRSPASFVRSVFLSSADSWLPTLSQSRGMAPIHYSARHSEIDFLARDDDEITKLVL
jgi:hypothetical protein